VKMRVSSSAAAFCLAGCLLSFGADEIPFPVATNLPGDPPQGGVRYWKGPFVRMAADGCYVSAIVSTNGGKRQWELWQNTWGDGGAPDRKIVVRRGPSLDELGPEETVCDGTVIDDVPPKGSTNSLAPGRGFTRPFVLQDAEFGRVVMACVCPDYLPGSVLLMPAILTCSADGRGLVYHGMIRGEPREETAGRIVWSDGGSLFRLPNGKWRMYLNGFGQVMTAVESDNLDGEWRFVRDREGRPVEMLGEFPKDRDRGGCFPTVLRVSEKEWHAWITDTWPPQSIWHFWSGDGLEWRMYGRQPEITRTAVSNRAIKCLRAFCDPDSGEIVGLLSVWVQGMDGAMRWGLHSARMPAGPPPD